MLPGPHWFVGKNVLITGGLGFIGATLAHRLVGYGAKVLVVDSLISEYGGNMENIRGIEDRININISDIRDVHSLRYLVKRMDLIFNLAGQTSHLDSMRDPIADLEINCAAQLSLLETLRHENPAAKVVFASTRQIYGRPDYLPVDEKHILRPTDVNGINKMAGEWYHILYNNVYGLRATALRLTNTYGPRMRIKDARQTFLGLWIRLALQGETFEVWGGDQLRDFCYVEDAVDALLMASADPSTDGRVFNLSGDSVVSLRQVAEMLVEAAGGQYSVCEFPSERKVIDIGDYYADDTSFRELTGWLPRVPLAEGLRRTVAYYREHLAAYL
jgi:UDP-glucose 4-epimerase